MPKTQTSINREKKEVTMKRVFNAPRQLVWDAFTKPELVAQWWGPRAFTTIVHEMDVRPGGTWHYVMHGTGDELKGTEFEGMESAGKAYYQEVQEPELLVYKDVFVDKDGVQIPGMPEVITTYRFTEENGQTTMILTGTYATLEELEKVVQMGFEQGMGESLDRLEELVTNK